MNTFIKRLPKKLAGTAKADAYSDAKSTISLHLENKNGIETSDSIP